MVGRENLTWWLRLPSKDHIKDYPSVAAAKNAGAPTGIFFNLSGSIPRSS
jgi:hypothetical protein